MLPDVTTFAEAGFPKVVVDSRYGLLAPAATPRERITKLNAAIGKALGRVIAVEYQYPRLRPPGGFRLARSRCTARVSELAEGRDGNSMALRS